MSQKRFKLDRPSYYHCMSKILNGVFLLGEAEKEKFVQIMRQVEAFAGVTVFTYVIMSNHFHILVAENKQVKLTDEQLLDRLQAFYGRHSKTYIRHEAHLRDLQKHGSKVGIEQFHARFQARMNCVSEFMKTVKQCFTQWYNVKNDRSGTVWNARFKSVLVEPGSDAMSHMAAYIDLNPLRAYLEEKPEEYRWCGYAEALAGGARAQAGIERLYESEGTLALGSGKGAAADWQVIGKRYRMLMFERGVAKSDRWGNEIRPGFDREQIEAVLKRGGSLPWHALARCRVKYFTEGLVLGTAEYIESHEAKIRALLGLKRARSAKRLHEFSGTDLHVFRRFWLCQVSSPEPPPG